MTRQELLERLKGIKKVHNQNVLKTAGLLDELIEDIELDGILDVQCPKDIADVMKLPQPK
jgi:hypothetical protein